MKVLATADVHVESWSMYDLTPGFRLAQYDRLGEWIERLIEEYGVGAVFIAGDYFHKPVNPPKVILTGIRLAKRLSDRVPVVLIHGQHDLDTRDRVSEGRSNSLVSLLNEVGSSNLYYLHNSSVNLGGYKVFGYGWEPVFSPNLDEALGAHVVLLHGQVRGSSTKSAKFEDGIDPLPLFPSARFIFVGDVHNHQVLGGGKVIVPGPPIYHTFNDGSAGVVIADLDTGSWEFIPSGYVRGERLFHFLKLVSETSSSMTGVKEEVDANSLVVKRTKGKFLDRSQVQHSSRNPLDIIRSVAEAEGLLGPYEFAVSRLSHATASPYDNPQSWTPLYLEVENFRSIEHLRIDFRDLGRLVFLSGPNGSGKSSLLHAIRFALTGDGDKSLVMAGAKSMRTVLALEYMGQEFVIERGFRGSQYLEVSVDGVPLEAPSLRDKQARLEDRLPIVRTFPELFYYDQFRPGLISSLTPKQRVDLISQVFGLSVVGDLEEILKEEISRVRLELSGLQGEKTAIESSLQSLLDLERSLAESKLSDSDLQEYQFLHEMVSELQAEIQKWDGAVREYGSKAAHLESLLKQSEQRLLTTQSTRRCYVCGSILDDQKALQVQQNLSDELEGYRKSLEEAISGYQEAIRNRESSIKALNKVISRFNELHDVVKKSETLLEHYQRVSESLKDALKKLEEIASLLEQRGSWVEGLEKFRKVLTTRAYTAILENISKVLSSGPVRVSTVQEFKTGSVKPTVELYFRISEDVELPFDLLSGGQRTLADTTFLFHLLSVLDGAGLLVFDETFRFLDSSSYEQVFEMLQQANASFIFYVSHDISPALRFDTQISVSRVGTKSVYRKDGV